MLIVAIVWRTTSRPFAPAQPVDPTLTTVPETPPVSAETTSVPTPPAPRWLLADPTIAAGTATALAGAGVTTERTATADLPAAAELIESLADEELIGPIVMVHVGTDGPLQADALDAVLDELAAIPTVVVATVHGDAAWSAPNNAVITTAAAQRSLSLFDWANILPSCPGTCLAEDGLSLTPDGAWFYIEQLAGHVGFSPPTRPTASSDLPIVAVTEDGAAVMIPADGSTTRTLLDAAPGDADAVSGIAVTDDDRAFVATCCEPLSGRTFAMQPSAPDVAPTTVAFASVIDFGDSERGLVYATPEELHVSDELNDRGPNGLGVTVPASIGRLIDVAWLDGFPAPPPAPFTYGKGQLAALSTAADGVHLATVADIARTSQLDHHTVIDADPSAALRLAGTADGMVLVFDPDEPGILTGYDPATLTVQRTVELPGPARSAWMDGTMLLWVDAAGALHDADRTVPGAYRWARR